MELSHEATHNVTIDSQVAFRESPPLATMAQGEVLIPTAPKASKKIGEREKKKIPSPHYPCKTPGLSWKGDSTVLLAHGI